jgi:hypothetical protein
LAVDPSGNVIVVGQFAASGDFGNGVVTSAGGADAFVAKYDPSGTLLWGSRSAARVLDS